MSEEFNSSNSKPDSLGENTTKVVTSASGELQVWVHFFQGFETWAYMFRTPRIFRERLLLTTG